ncbi:uncharacterized protein BHQ10_008816 [Talaromyces amestolkiae]|uniref:Uncharacterized protein n=1 Tax=Talaromyces amestolkiae TaxID=1196081 RepID=A0A364LAF3_TALAM|nr:uncharacterized protein BHQ10_008816 [Talaromyces amestolkiae]RAO72804.1 hypothetical protein BHQ10_008816 [Talaromyces amestolkiae]
MLKETKDLFLTLPEDEDWFPSYVKEKLQQMLKPTEPGFNLNEFYNCIDQDKNFGVFVLKMAVEILFDHLPLWERISEYDTTTKQEPLAAESTGEEEASAVAETADEEDAPAAETADEEDAPASETADEEDAPAAETADEEDAPAAESVYEEDAPAAESAYEEEAPAAADTADEPGVSQNDEAEYVEYAPTNDESPKSLQVAEARPSEDAAEALHSHMVRAKAADLRLYLNWGGISSKKKGQ